MDITRRDLVVGAAAGAAMGLLGCRRDAKSKAVHPGPGAENEPAPHGDSGKKPPPGQLDVEGVVTLLRDSPREGLIANLASAVKRGLTRETFVAGMALCAARHCRSSSYDAMGTVSHSLLGLLPALQLADRMPRERQLIPLFQSALWIAGETRQRRDEPTLTAPKPCGLECGAGPFEAAYATDAPQSALVRHADGLLAAGETRRALAALIAISMRQRGHGGHGIIMVAGAARLHHQHGCAALVLRAPAAYLASFHAPDDTGQRVRVAAQGSGVSHASAAASLKPVAALTATTARAAEWFARVEGDLFAPLHVVTSIAATADALVHLGGAALPAIDAREVAMRGGAWLDRAMEEKATRRRPSTSARDLKRAIAAGEQHDAVAAAGQGLEHVPWLCEVAAATARPTVQHSVKLLDATLAAAVRAQPADRAALLGASARFLASAARRVDPRYPAILDALDLEPLAGFPG